MIGLTKASWILWVSVIASPPNGSSIAVQSHTLPMENKQVCEQVEKQFQYIEDFYPGYITFVTTCLHKGKTDK